MKGFITLTEGYNNNTVIINYQNITSVSPNVQHADGQTQIDFIGGNSIYVLQSTKEIWNFIAHASDQPSAIF